MNETGRYLALRDVRADLQVLVSVRRQIGEFAGRIGLTPDTITDLQLATYEALANVVEHAYPPGEPGTFDLIVEDHDGRFLTVVIVDRGSWKQETDNRTTRRGHGLRLMRACSDAVQVEHGDGGTWIRMQWNYGKSRTESTESPEHPRPTENSR